MFKAIEYTPSSPEDLTAFLNQKSEEGLMFAGVWGSYFIFIAAFAVALEIPAHTEAANRLN